MNEENKSDFVLELTSSVIPCMLDDLCMYDSSSNRRRIVTPDTIAYSAVIQFRPMPATIQLVQPSEHGISATRSIVTNINNEGDEIQTTRARTRANNEMLNNNNDSAIIILLQH